ncbi:hypothetical protein INT47_004679 [Mucor saturninus]|uniref:Uncharacterized protein n=1 Tax=Mucor saturninus TaxID=64648 RepID=A0A8H7QIT6_9FUNG|nr:hypothetical protein INT47_004679 [Mucor saturninus]
MNNSATVFRISKLEEEVSKLNGKTDRQYEMIKDLMQPLAPSFAQPMDGTITKEAQQASKQANQTGVPNSLNPNFLGKRDIPKLLEEASQASRSTVYPPARPRLLALINYFKKENNICNLDIDDPANTRDYNILKTIARKTHDDLTEEILKKLKKTDSQAILPLSSNISSEVVSKYAYILENNAFHLGFPLHRCESSWAANLLLSRTEGTEQNRKTT